MVGSLGASATAGVSVVASSIWLINGIMAGGVGYSVQVANAWGRRTTPWPGKSSAGGAGGGGSDSSSDPTEKIKKQIEA